MVDSQVAAHSRFDLDGKMLVNLTFAVPSILLAGTILTVSGQTGGLKPVWVFLVPLAYACFSSVLGNYH